MSKKYLILILIILQLFTVSCVQKDSVQPKTLYTDSEKRFRVAAGEGWEKMTGSLNEDAVIELGDLQKQKYFILRADEKARSEYEFKEYAEYIKTDFINKLGENIDAELKSTVIGKKQAFQMQITASAKDGNITYILSVIDDADYYIITCGWYRSEMKKLNHEDVLSVIGSYENQPQ